MKLVVSALEYCKRDIQTKNVLLILIYYLALMPKATLAASVILNFDSSK